LPVNYTAPQAKSAASPKAAAESKPSKQQQSTDTQRSESLPEPAGNAPPGFHF
jgi:hypothetical protein